MSDWPVVFRTYSKIEATIKDADEARAIYDEIVRKMRDPALLEYVGRGVIQASVFPIQPGADSRVRQNLALVIGLQGRFQEAEVIARQELTAEQAEANLTYLKAMLAQDNNWQKLSANDDNNTN